MACGGKNRPLQVIKKNCQYANAEYIDHINDVRLSKVTVSSEMQGSHAAVWSFKQLPLTKATLDHEERASVHQFFAPINRGFYVEFLGLMAEPLEP